MRFGAVYDSLTNFLQPPHVVSSSSSGTANPRYEIQEMQAQDTNAKGGCVRHQGRQNGKRQSVVGKLTTAKVAMRRAHNRKQNTRVRWSLTPFVNYDIVSAEGQTVHRQRQQHKYSIQVDSNRQAQQGAVDDFGASKGEQRSLSSLSLSASWPELPAHPQSWHDLA